MGQGSNYIEKEANNTYGIEIEFGTHDSQMLSFTHIEVAYLYPAAAATTDDGWKIETDADYTLELVSPILKFDTQETARNFRDSLMRLLEESVRNGILLGDMMPVIQKFVQNKFVINGSVWTYTPNALQLNLQISWITAKKLQESLSWENWDEDTDLEQVLAFKKTIAKERTAGEASADVKTTARMKDVMLTKSRKHGGLPSSQLNLPLQLPAYVFYQTKYKRNNAWKRLWGDKISSPRYIQEKIDETGNAYPELKAIKVWADKYLNVDYTESRIDEKIPFWHRYWLWLETFYICSKHISQDVGWNSFEKMDQYIGSVQGIINSKTYTGRKDIDKALKDLYNDVNAHYGENIENDVVKNLWYMIIQKLVAGALSEMSETLQMNAQIEIMKFEGDYSMDQLKQAITGSDFMQFHYALKDLTSLWLKCPLIDILNAEKTVRENGNAVDLVIARLKSLTPEFLTALVTRALEANLSLLGWYHAVCEANNQGFDYEWDEFRAYNMPSVPAFEKSLGLSCASLISYVNKLADPPPRIICQYAQLPNAQTRFLQRAYVFQGNVVKVIAPWEGRWDTMKGVINTGPYPRYLVEHRNN
jgi:hypothetical protein